MPGRKFNASVIQFRAVKGRPGENIEALIELCGKAVEEGSVIINLPEMCLTGYIWPDPQSIMPYAEEPEGPSFLKFSNFCRNNRCFISYGYAEKNRTAVYNAQNLIGPDGRLLLTYRKSHLFEADESWAQTGDKGFMNTGTDYGVMGMGICMDINYDDFVEFHINNRTDLILFPSNWLEEGLDVIRYWRYRLGDYRGAVLISNTFGTEQGVGFCGRSSIINNGVVLGSLPPDGNGVLTCNISL